MHPSASLLVTAGISVVALGVASLIVIGHATAARSERAPRASVVVFALGVAAWVTVVAVLAATGTLRRYDVRPPPMVLAVSVGLVLAVATAGSSIGARLARGLPLAALVGFHAFRLPLELLMHRASVEGTMPVQMSFAGWNFDVISGASAIVVAWLVARGTAPRWLVPAWAVMSSLLLGAIIVIAITSTPLVAAFGSDPARLNTWVGWFPFAWLPCVLVPAAVAGQIVIFRKLAASSVSARVVRARPYRA